MRKDLMTGASTPPHRQITPLRAFNAAVALEARGRSREAEWLYQYALALSPDHLALAQCKRFTANDPRLAAIGTLARDMMRAPSGFRARGPPQALARCQKLHVLTTNRRGVEWKSHPRTNPQGAIG
jgi:hypothetical protein